nr:hypothetical protein [uncultured Halomonas sp.]
MALHIKPRALLRVPIILKKRLMNDTPAQVQAFTRTLQAKGYDGVVTTLQDRDGTQEIVLFDEADALDQRYL